MKRIICPMVFLLIAASCNSVSKKDLKEHYKQIAVNAVRWKDYSTAAYAWQALYNLDKSNAPLLDSVYYNFLSGRNTIAAAAIGNEILRGHIKDTTFLFTLSDVNRGCGNFQAAIQVIQLRSALTHDSLPDNYDIAACYFEMGDANNTIVYLDKVLRSPEASMRMASVSGEVVPYTAAALNVIGVVETRKGNFANAEKVFLESLKIAPNFSFAKNNLQMVRSGKKQN